MTQPQRAPHLISKANPPEKWWLALLILVYTLVSLACLNTFPVHVDEINYVDPAASLFLGRGFTTGTWYAQRHDLFWASNLPLFPFLLAKWLAIFGFTPTSVRSFCLGLNIVGVLALWGGLVRRGLLANAKWRLGLVALLFTCSGAVYLLVYGRPDALTTCLAGLVWLASTWRNPGIRWLTLAALGMLSALTALQLDLFLAFSSILLLYLFRLQYLKEMAAVAVGGIIGTCLLVGMYWHHGVLADFAATVLPVISGKKNLYLAGQSATHKWGGLFDHSYLLVLAASLAVTLRLLRGPAPARRKTLISLWWFMLAIPVLTHFAGMYPKYYSWMAVVPGAVIIFHILHHLPVRERMFKGGMIAIITLAGLIGYPRVWANAWRWRADDVNGMTLKYLTPYLGSHEVALVNRQAFYAIRPQCDTLYYLDHSPWRMDPDEKQSLTIMVMSPDEFSRIKEVIGGEWLRQGDVLSVPNRNLYAQPWSSWYRDNPTIDLAVYRRL